MEWNEDEQRVQTHFSTLTKTPSMQYFYQCGQVIDVFFSFFSEKKKNQAEKQDKY